MDTEAVEFMLFLKRNVTELKRLGSEWGMTTEEINACIDKALENEDEAKKEQANKTTPMEIWLTFCGAVKLFFKMLALVFILFFALFMLMSFHEPTGNYIGKVMQPYGYNIFRFVRLATLPLHKILNLTYYYDSECLLENPFYQEPVAECDWCHDIHEVKELEKANFPLVKRYINEHQPFIFKGEGLEPLQEEDGIRLVQFEDLVELYTLNRDTLDVSVARFYSTDPQVRDLASLFGLATDDNLYKKTKLSVQWTTKNMASSQVLRKLFPRPKFVPPESEVALEKQVYIDGPQAQQIEVVGGFYQAVYVQAVKGRRLALIRSIDMCHGLCSPVHTEIKEGQIFVFSPALWRVDIMPNSDQTSIMLVGSFTV